MPATLVWVALLSFAAQEQPRAAFEVASVKPASPLGPMGAQADCKGGPGTADPGMYTCRNCPISWVFSEAFDVQPFEWVAPDWIADLRFDFSAKVPDGTTKEAFRVMLQNLLADRFRMAVHREKRETTVFEMSVGRSGPKFRDAALENAPAADSGFPLLRDKDGFPILGPNMTMAIVPGHARIRSNHQPISWFIRMLAAQLHAPVVDATGLAGKYDFVLSWAWEESPSGSPDGYSAELANAVQSQLGLKLERKKGQAEFLVVDHIERKPSEN